MSINQNNKKVSKIRKFLSTTQEQRALAELINKENYASILQEKEQNPINAIVKDSTYKISSVLQVLQKDNRIHGDITIGKNLHDVK